MIKTEIIIDMTTEEILNKLTINEYNILCDLFDDKLFLFSEMYTDGARLSGEDEYFSPSEYLKIYLNTIY